MAHRGLLLERQKFKTKGHYGTGLLEHDKKKELKESLINVDRNCTLGFLKKIIPAVGK